MFDVILSLFLVYILYSFYASYRRARMDAQVQEFIEVSRQRYLDELYGRDIDQGAPADISQVKK